MILVQNCSPLAQCHVFSYFPFGFDGRMWDLIVSVPDHCLSFYFAAFTINGQTICSASNKKIYQGTNLLSAEDI